MVAAVDHLASSAGVAVLRAGGTAADAAVAAGAVLAVTNQQESGMGGDLFALVHRPGEPVAALCAAGRAGSGADAVALRAEGNDRVPPVRDIRCVTVPGCVDGWLELHRRFGRLPLPPVLDAAITYAAAGFPVSRLLSVAASLILGVEGADDYRDPAMAAGGRLPPGTLIRRPGVAAALAAIAAEGRDAWYEGPFGEGLLALGEGLYRREDLARCQADWVEPLARTVWGHELVVPPPPSQAYLVLAGGAVAEGLGLPDDPDDPAWAHLLAEAARATGLDRDAVLHDGADGDALVAPDRLAAQLAAVDPERRSAAGPVPSLPGDTTVCCAVDADRMGVTLIQSNASWWGAQIVETATGVFLHNRGAGFSLDAGHPALLAPGRRPPHTLAPVLVRRADGSLRAVVGTRGGDTQPHIVLQLLARLLVADQSPGRAVGAGRFVLGPGGFDVWRDGGPAYLRIERHAPAAWEPGLAARGHDVRRSGEEIDAAFGHAQLIEATDGVLAGLADPRALDGAAAGY
jgi:gamma-glutamyltranspeptidase/glutathione hydrolase